MEINFILKIFVLKVKMILIFFFLVDRSNFFLMGRFYFFLIIIVNEVREVFYVC